MKQVCDHIFTFSQQDMIILQEVKQGLLGRPDFLPLALRPCDPHLASNDIDSLNSLLVWLVCYLVNLFSLVMVC